MAIDRINLHSAIAEFLDSLVDIEMPDVWKIVLDDAWHRCDDRCAVCNSIPCIYKE